MSGTTQVTYTGELNAKALAVTFQHLIEFIEQEDAVTLADVKVDEVEGIVRRYMDTGELNAVVSYTHHGTEIQSR